VRVKHQVKGNSVKMYDKQGSVLRIETTTIAGRRSRALQPWSDPDATLLRIVNRGEFVTTGFRNRDISELMTPSTSTTTPELKKRRRAATTRLQVVQRDTAALFSLVVAQ
jgi:hypothetical protein